MRSKIIFMSSERRSKLSIGLKLSIISAESTKKLGIIHKSRPKWNKNNHTKSRSRMKPIRTMSVQNEKYHMPILSHKGHMLKSINAIAIMTPITRKSASFPRGLGMFHMQKPFSVTFACCGLAGTRCFGYFFFASSSCLGSLSSGTSSLKSEKIQPNLIESSIFSIFVIAVTSLNCFMISVLFASTISWNSSPIKI